MAQRMESATIEEPRFAKWLFASPAAAGIWFLARLYLGYNWLHAGWEKVTGTTGGTFAWKLGFGQESWLRTSGGLKGFAGYALQGAGGQHAAVNYGWYAAFLRWIERSGGWLAPIIAIGEVAIGVALLIGLFTGVAAFLGGLLTVSFGLAGVAGVNPAFFVLEIFLILAWRNAGYFGADRYVIPAYHRWLHGDKRVAYPRGVPQAA